MGLQDQDDEFFSWYPQSEQYLIDQVTFNDWQTRVYDNGEQLGVHFDQSYHNRANSAVDRLNTFQDYKDAQAQKEAAVQLNPAPTASKLSDTATDRLSAELYNTINNVITNGKQEDKFHLDYADKWNQNFQYTLGPDNPAFIDATLSYQDIEYGYRLEPNENGVLWRVSAAGIPHPDDLDKYVEQQRVIESATNLTQNNLVKTIVANADTSIANGNLIVSILGKQPIDTGRKLAQADEAKLYAFNFNNFDRKAAVKYALTYWENPNTPKYFDYGGVDCTNFVSQCWHAAGIPMSSTWFSENTIHIGENPERPLATRSWVGVEEFAKYMVNSGCAYLSNDRNDAQIGDVIQFQNEYGWHHSVIISRIDENGEIYYASHSDPNDYKRLSEVYPGKEQIRFLCVYKPTGTA